jgi:hypothetical protein
MHAASYSYKLRYEFKKYINAKILVLTAVIFSEYTYSVCVCVCVFREASGDKIKKNVRWLADSLCLSLLCIL